MHGKVAVSSVTNTELGYLSGATRSIQTQLNECELAVPYYAGYIGSTGTSIRDNGLFTFTVSKTKGAYTITFGTTLPSN